MKSKRHIAMRKLEDKKIRIQRKIIKLEGLITLIQYDLIKCWRL